MALTIAAGVAVRRIWGVRVELFFEAFALFGCMALLEPGEAPPARGADRRFRLSATLAIALTLLAVIAMNAALILNLSNAQSEEIGNTHLDVIRSDLQETITEAQTELLRVAIGAEQLMESGASREALTEYFYAQRDKHAGSDSFLNVYIAGPDWHIVPDFVGPEDFHAAERVWYIGAQDCPGEAYITEPYMDANGQGMCFTVSTLLSVGERADEKLPEYADILRRIKASKEHGSFHVELDGRLSMIFSSETSNNWYLILSVDTSALYGDAVRWLDDVSKKYPDISLCYMANPYNEHPVIMNNGWEPGEDYRPETRPWHRATERAADGFSISAPYLDAQSGNYCITLSRVVYGKQGEFLGIFGIDFFLDKLIHVLGESYTSQSYAFLVDSDGVIINHPNAAYQMGENSSTSVEDTEYADACSREGVTTMRDYSSRLMACLSRRMGSGFTVLVANRWWNIYGSVVLVTAIFLVLFGACLVFIVALINRLVHWQQEVNQRLVDSAEEAQSANRAKSQFLSQMSHEIRTPMNAIIGLDSIALRDESISPRTREELEKIGASARHLLALINDILDMSRIESGRMVLREETFSFREFLEQIDIIVGSQCEDKGLRFVCNRVEPLDDYFIGDDLKLKQVVINILGNSVKFTDPPGVITFTVEQLAAAGDRVALRFTMEDTGIGMDKAFLPKLFEAFSQEDTSSTNQYGGSGLGMAITKSIVEMMGGEIGVESEKGLGTTFAVTVTLGRAQAPDAKRPESATIPIIALTANAFEEDVRQCEQAGMNAHMSKPVDIDKLKQMLRRIL